MPVSGSRTWMWTIAAPAARAPTAESTICSGVTGIAALWPGTLIPPVIAHEQKTGALTAFTTTLSAPPTRSVNVR